MHVITVTYVRSSTAEKAKANVRILLGIEGRMFWVLRLVSCAKKYST